MCCILLQFASKLIGLYFDLIFTHGISTLIYKAKELQKQRTRPFYVQRNKGVELCRSLEGAAVRFLSQTGFVLI